HWYFTLKDPRAQIRCVMFKGANFHVRPQPRDGDSVLVRGQATLYPARGDLQLVCEHLEPAGEGALLRAFGQLKARLAAEGLFDERHKRPLPHAPRAIGVITSATGAAVQDILTTLSRRFPLGTVILYPVPVQGAEAAPAIVRALRELPQKAAVDVVLLARGGGSLEDLWAFNEEAVARAIRACAVPVVSGVGHEIDFTIADFAADLRAPTPTAAAELASPNLAEWAQRVRTLETDLAAEFFHGLAERRAQVERIDARLQVLHPGRRLNDTAQRLDDLDARLRLAQANHARQLLTRLRHAQQRLRALQPVAAIRSAEERVSHLELRLRSAGVLRLQALDSRLARAESLLHGLSPQAVLDRGYAIALAADGRALTDAEQLQAGAMLELRLARGRVEAEVKAVKP
ncbi:MAG TPA: exodeoxyribonuclease VII large subunit, partial [Stenotrophobium sp.]|nr:exodeoxyribonuclease VII large subunit [Stenotrophobium sp.]